MIVDIVIGTPFVVAYYYYRGRATDMGSQVDRQKVELETLAKLDKSRQDNKASQNSDIKIDKS
jgi:hypothetical protein